MKCVFAATASQDFIPLLFSVISQAAVALDVAGYFPENTPHKISNIRESA